MIAFLVLIGFVGAYFWQILAAVGLFFVARWGSNAARQYRQEQEALAEELAATAARADEQHAQILECDERGMYGAYPPAC